MSFANKEELFSTSNKTIVGLTVALVIVASFLGLSVSNNDTLKIGLENSRSVIAEKDVQLEFASGAYALMRQSFIDCDARFDNNEERLIENVRAVKESNLKAAELQEEINETAKKRDEEKKKAEAAAKLGENIIRSIVVGSGSKSE